ncbi:hypothetical protein EMIT0196MI5_110171 [Pseudomonas sp. IT-196MI5]
MYITTNLLQLPLTELFHGHLRLTRYPCLPRELSRHLRLRLSPGGRSPGGCRRQLHRAHPGHRR